MYTEGARNGGQALVGRPQRQRRENRRCQQVRVDPTQSPTHQAPALDERKHLLVARNRHRGQRPNELEDFGAPGEVAADKLADHERVSPNRPVFQQLRKSRVSLAKMVDPD